MFSPTHFFGHSWIISLSSVCSFFAGLTPFSKFTFCFSLSLVSLPVTSPWLYSCGRNIVFIVGICVLLTRLKNLCITKLHVSFLRVFLWFNRARYMTFPSFCHFLSILCDRHVLLCQSVRLGKMLWRCSVIKVSWILSSCNKNHYRFLKFQKFHKGQTNSSWPESL